MLLRFVIMFYMMLKLGLNSTCNIYLIRENLWSSALIVHVYFIEALLQWNLIHILDRIPASPMLFQMIVQCETYSTPMLKEKPLGTIADSGCIHVIIVVVRSSFISRLYSFLYCHFSSCLRSHLYLAVFPLPIWNFCLHNVKQLALLRHCDANVLVLFIGSS